VPNTSFYCRNIFITKNSQYPYPQYQKKKKPEKKANNRFMMENKAKIREKTLGTLKLKTL
jgi:hypothetical protein